MKHIEYKVQTCNGNPEVIKVINGFADSIVAGQHKMLTIQQAQTIAKEMNKTLIVE